LLTLRFQDEEFLPQANIDLEITLISGEVLVLTGENGVGKTTLARRIEAAYPEMVYVEQASLDHFYNRRIGDIKKILEDVRSKSIRKEWLELLWNGFELNQKSDRRIETLSGGESQALKLALALCQNKDFYLLDEPFQYLDQGKKDFLYLFIEKLQGLKKYILIIEHNFRPQFHHSSVMRLENVAGTIMRGEG
jgi:ABC-type Mn2+/Zn2+ transport system ATPase subunit